MTFAVELELYVLKVNHHAQYLGQRSFLSKAIVRTDTPTECITWTTNIVGNDE